MADYIDRNILCQAYVNIKPVDLTADQYDVFRSQVDHFIEARGRFFLYTEILPNVELKEGSLKVYATIAGSIYLAIGQYGSFRSGLDYLVTDVKRLSDSIVNECLFLSKSRHENIIHVESRIGIVGSLKNIVNDIDYVQAQMGRSDVGGLAKRLQKIRDDIDNLLGKLKDPNDIPFVKNNLYEIVNNCLPENPKTPDKKREDPDANAFYREERLKILNQLKSKP